MGKSATTSRTLAFSAALLAAAMLGQGFSTTAKAVTWTTGTFTPSGAPTQPPGVDYLIPPGSFDFSTNPIAYKWYYTIEEFPQGGPNFVSEIASLTGFTDLSIVNQKDSIGGGTGFTTIDGDNPENFGTVISFHAGSANMVFLLSYATIFSLFDYVQGGGFGALSNFRVLSGDCNANCAPPPLNAVPLPAGIVLLLTGLGGMGFLSRRHKRKLL